MKLHANAALSLKGRRDLSRRVVSGERTVSEAAAAAEVSVRCARKWVARYRSEGELGLLDRSSAPRAIPHRTSERRVQAALTGALIGALLGFNATAGIMAAITTIVGAGCGANLGLIALDVAQICERPETVTGEPPETVPPIANPAVEH